MVSQLPVCDRDINPSCRSSSSSLYDSGFLDDLQKGPKILLSHQVLHITLFCFFCKKQPPPPHRNSKLCNFLLVPICACFLYTLVWPLVSPFLQIQQDCWPLELISSWETVTLPLLVLLLLSHYFSTYIHG